MDLEESSADMLLLIINSCPERVRTLEKHLVTVSVKEFGSPNRQRRNRIDWSEGPEQ